jgi:HEAT repeat protein
MTEQELLDYFDCLEGVQDSDADSDLLKEVNKAGDIGRTVIEMNLKEGRYLLRSLWVCKELGMKELLPDIEDYLASEDVAVRVASAIASSSLGSQKGKESLQRMIDSGEIPAGFV